MERRGYLLAMLIPVAAVVAAFLGVPLFFTLLDSLRVEGGTFPSLQNYYRILTSRLYLNSFRTSLLLSLSTTALGMLFGVPLSYFIYGLRGRLKSLVLFVVALPLTFSGLVVGFAFIVLLGASGFITLSLKELFGVNPLSFSRFLFTWKGLMVAYLYFLIPRTILTMMSAWERFDWNLVDAARSLGASWWTTVFRVVLPVVAPALLASSSLIFAVSMGAFGTAFALTGTQVNIVPLLIYTHMSEVGVDLGRASALSVLLALLTTGLVLVYEASFRGDRRGA